MASTLAKSAPSMPINSLEPRMAKASIAVNRPEASVDIDPSSDLVSMAFESWAACGMSDKEAAYTMALDPAQLSRIKSRQARMPLDALGRMPDAFWLEFRRRVDQARSLTEESTRALKAARIGELVRLLVEVA